MSYTPGPWHQPTQGIVARDTGAAFNENAIAEVFSPSDARLIAAAPDLLEALKAAERHIRPVPNTREVRAQVRAAISKAEGA